MKNKILIALLLVWILSRILRNELDQEKYSEVSLMRRIYTNKCRKGKKLRQWTLMEDILQKIRTVNWEKQVRRHISRKKNNKKKHSEEGNRRNKGMTMGWWNNKAAQGHLGRNTQDKVATILKKYKLDLLGLSESNILQDDETSELKIKGYNLVNDKLIKFGRARSSLYIKENIDYQIRDDLMDEETAEVWLEIIGNTNQIVGTFYREQAEVRGAKSRTGSETQVLQKERLHKWTKKVVSKIIPENKKVLLGGDFNGELLENGGAGDVYGEILEDMLIEEGGLEQIIKWKTHQSIRNGTNCKSKIIEQIYTDSPEKTSNTRAILESGSHHKIVMTTMRERIPHKGTLQHRARQRNKYTRQEYHEELYKKKWNLEPKEGNRTGTEIRYLENMVALLTNNLCEAMDKICPTKTINKRASFEPWLKNPVLLEQQDKE